MELPDAEHEALSEHRMCGNQDVLLEFLYQVLVLASCVSFPVFLCKRVLTTEKPLLTALPGVVLGTRLLTFTGARWLNVWDWHFKKRERCHREFLSVRVLIRHSI